ncbi:hypothetical protein AGMMS50230_19950 [Spirochaetia bacterium]|nr:hypothetical protein AGMMS50230_19950 [Spirochaetia bacterium]
MREDTERDYILTEALEIHFIDMMKFRRLREKDFKNDTLQRWMTWFDKDSPPAVVEEVVKMDAAIQKAEARMAFVSNDKEAFRAYQMREMALSDWTSGVNHAKQEGRIEGKIEGRIEGKIEIARSMKTDKAAIEKIMQYTGLTREEIDKA